MYSGPMPVKEYLVIILGYFVLFIHKNLCFEYSLEVHQGANSFLLE